MDSPACDPDALRATYVRFRTVNRVFAGWQILYRRFLRPRMEPGRAYTLLDVGFGGGDVPRALRQWAERDGLKLCVTAIDPDPRAAAFARSLPPSKVRFEQTDTAELVQRGARFDFVTSNHLLHHLPGPDLPTFLNECAELGSTVLHNDIARADLAYVGFAALTGPFFRGSFITPDGLTSVRRSYTKQELRSVAPEGWRVSSPYPFRLLLSRGL